MDLNILLSQLLKTDDTLSGERSVISYTNAIDLITVVRRRLEIVTVVLPAWERHVSSVSVSSFSLSGLTRVSPTLAAYRRWWGWFGKADKTVISCRLVSVVSQHGYQWCKGWALQLQRNQRGPARVLRRRVRVHQGRGGGERRPLLLRARRPGLRVCRE